jgi:Caspase domain
MARIFTLALVALQLTVVPARAQDQRRMVFAAGPRDAELAVTIEYADPSGVHALLGDSRVLPVRVDARNLSSRPVTVKYRDLRLNLGGDLPLLPADAGDAFDEVQHARGVNPFLRFFGGQSTAFQPQQLRVALERLQLGDVTIPPGQTRGGLVFFIRPASIDRASMSGVMWLETSGRALQMLETKDFVVYTKAPQQSGFTALLKQTWNRYLSSTPPAFDRSYALLIGIGKYRSLPVLESPAKDVKKMAAFLAAQGFDEVVSITDEAVTPETFRQPQKYFKNKVQADDRFLFYYSGHGMGFVEDGRTRGYFPLHDEVYNGNQRSIAMDSLVASMKSFTAQHLLVIVDSCFSGLAVDAIELKGDAVTLRDPRIDQESLNRLSRGSARYLIMASRADEVSLAGRQWNGSLFTDTLLRGLRGGAESYQTHIVTTRALYAWLQRMVPDEAKKVSRELMPLFLDLGPASQGEFIFVQ